MAARLIALDLDGTALVGHRFLSAATRSAILTALAEGILIVPATGRSYRDIPQAVLDIPGIPCFLTSNGANIVDGKSGESIYSDLIPWQDAVEILRILGEYDVQPSVHLKGRSTNLKTADPRIVARYGSTDYFTRHSVDNLEAFVEREKADVEKIFAVLLDQSVKETLTERIRAGYRLTFSASAPDNIELNSPSASKGHGLAVICDRFGISREETAVIGDSVNDISMFRFAKKCIAMGNAEACIKALSRHVTKSCEEDGAALALEKLIRGEW